ncbi:MAG: EVE domain-containing protein [Chloroflexi bacterium]|nr:EVE domain-containing protein [Chloroflexota bacterium]
MPRNYWMLVITPENFAVTRSLGYTVQGFTALSRKKAERMEAGDRLLYYLSGAQQFAATATVASTIFEEHTPLWRYHKEGEDFAYRIQIKPEVVLDDPASFLDAREIGPRMEYVKRWVPETWPLAFVGELHLIPRKDFSLVEEEMRKVANRRRRSQAAV